MLQIVYCLTGDSKFPPVLDRQVEQFLQKTHSEIEELIWEGNFFGYLAAEQLYKSFTKCSKEIKTKILLSPDFYECLWYATRRRDLPSLEKIAALFDQTSHDFSVPELSSDWAESISNIPHCQLLGETITVDFGSDRCRRTDPTSPVMFCAYEPLTTTEINRISQKLISAFSEIEEATPTFARLIRNYTRVVYVRKVGTLAPASEQVDTELGAIRLRNVHLDTYTHAQLVDDLIHESIHNFLGTFEYLNFPFIPYGSNIKSTVRPVSPWSLRPIMVLPYIHAVFVYFGMMSYANIRLKESGLTDDTRRSMVERRNRYSSGFLMPGKLRDHVNQLTTVDERVSNAIDWMQKIVQSQFQSDIVARNEVARNETPEHV